MIKSFLSVAAASALAVPSAFAGVYINAESNDGYTGSDYTGRTIDLHVGYEGSVSKVDYYIHGGPAIKAVADVDGSTSSVSGKIGGTVNVSEKLGIYGEFSGFSYEDTDNHHGKKIGAKFSF